MAPRLLVFASLIAALPSGRLPAAESASAPHCAQHAQVKPIAGDPGAFRIDTRLGSTTARYPGRTGITAPSYTIRAYADHWEADFNVVNGLATLVVPVGATVRWHLMNGIHTVTSGAGADDPQAGAGFDYLLDETHPDFDSTFASPDTIDFFCYFHEPAMAGRLVVSANAGVPGGGLPTTLAFTRGPMPNPSSGVTAFTIAVPRAARVTVEVLDLAGRRIATLHQDVLTAGEHPFRWRGDADRGGPVAAGAYLVRLRMGGSAVTRRFSLLR